MPLNDIVNVDEGALLESNFFMRDCQFPVSDARRRTPLDAVVANMPVFLGHWDDSTVMPFIDAQSFDIDTTGIVDTDCDTGIVNTTLSECALAAPNMKEISLKTESLKITDMIPAFCKQNNITQQQLGLILRADGTIDPGNPYAVNFARFAYSAVMKTMLKVIAYSVLSGDAANDYECDGLYTQLANGWDAPGGGLTDCDDAVNIAQVVDWAALCGNPGVATSPDETTAAGQTITLWGTSFDVPEGLNLGELLEQFLIPAIQATWTDAAGGVDMWEMHVPHGYAIPLLRNFACITACNLGGVVIDESDRARLQSFVNTKTAELYPSGQRFPVMETRHVADNTLWFGAREIGGRPTYGVAFRSMSELMQQLGMVGQELYGKGQGVMMDDALLAETDTLLRGNFEAAAFQWDVIKTSMKCFEFGAMAEYSTIALSRHTWLKIEDVDVKTAAPRPASEVSVDSTALFT